MRSALGLCFCLFLCLTISAQDFVLTPIAETLCSPGVDNKSMSKGIVFEYGINPDGRVKPRNGTIFSEPTKIGGNHRYMFKMKVPILNKKKIKLLAGWNYYSEEYNFDYIGTDSRSIFNTIDDQELKSSRISLYMIHPINHKYYLGVKAVASYNGDYNGVFEFDKRYSNYDIAAIFGVKKRSNLEWGVGLLARRNYIRGTSMPIVPFAIFNHTFNEKWGIEMTIPTSLKGRYNINEKNIMLFGTEFDSRTYSIDINDTNFTDPIHYTMRRSELRLTLQYQRHLGSWFWMELKTGFVSNFTTTFEVRDDGQRDVTPLTFTPSNGPFFKMGLFISPPRDKFK
jgi:hypothetical protein